MKMTVDIPDDIMNATVEFTGAKTKREAILTAMEDYLHRQKVASVVAMFGTFKSFDTNDEIEAREG